MICCFEAVHFSARHLDPWSLDHESSLALFDHSFSSFWRWNFVLMYCFVFWLLFLWLYLLVVVCLLVSFSIFYFSFQFRFGLVAFVSIFWHLWVGFLLSCCLLIAIPFQCINENLIIAIPFHMLWILLKKIIQSWKLLNGSCKIFSLT